MDKIILNARGAIYHLDMKPDELGDTVILVGDQGRVPLVSKYFDRVIQKGSNREFHWATGFLGEKKVTVLSSGIGADNIDIVMNELGALANIDFATNEYKATRKSLSIIRIGTSGTIQASIPVGSYCVSSFAVGLDNTIKFYEGGNTFFEGPLSRAIKSQVNWDPQLDDPYSASCDKNLLKSLFGSDEYLKGITVSAPGFYGPQGRDGVIHPYSHDLNQRLSAFSFNFLRVLNYEMEAAPIYAFSQLLGHRAITVCLVLANRTTDSFLSDYKPHMDKLIRKVLGEVKASSDL